MLPAYLWYTERQTQRYLNPKTQKGGSHNLFPGCRDSPKVLHFGRNLFHEESEGALHQGMIVRIMCNGQQVTKATDVFVELLDLVGALLRVTYDPDVFQHVIHVHRLVRHGGVVLEIVQ